MKHKGLIVILICLLTAVFCGCQKRTITQPDSAKQDQPEQKAESKQQKDREQVNERKLDGKVESLDKSGKDSQYVESKENLFADILFDYDKYDVKETYKPVFQAISAWMSKNSTARLSVEGHCDERGTNEYNLALGDRRAKAVKDYLVSLGVTSGRIDVISYGEEKPICTEQADACWAKNRRAHFAVLTKVGK